MRGVYLSSSVLAWWILGSKEHEAWMGRHHLLGLWYVQLTIVIQQLASGWGETREKE